MITWLLPAAAAVCVAPPVPRALPAGITLNDETLQQWVALVEPTPEECSWEQVPWQVSFADGLRAADAAGRPLLFWGMNGHPLGCT